jgi:hypothetical protein
MYIHHISVGWTRDQEIAQRLEVAVGIVAGQILRCLGIAEQSIRVRNGAGGIGWPIGAVSPGA